MLSRNSQQRSLKMTHTKITIRALQHIKFSSEKLFQICGSVSISARVQLFKAAVSFPRRIHLMDWGFFLGFFSFFLFLLLCFGCGAILLGWREATSISDQMEMISYQSGDDLPKSGKLYVDLGVGF